MSVRKSNTPGRKVQPQQITRLLELAEKRGYSARALTALTLSAIVAHTSRPRRRKAVAYA